MAVTLYGYRYSVYTRIARMALMLRGVDYVTVEVDPFTEPADQMLRSVTPFHRVPVLNDDGFMLFETSAITRYIATCFPGPALVPTAPKAAARMEQVIAIIDAYGYRPMVRQVFGHGVFRPLIGADADAGEIEQGLEAAQTVMMTLDVLAAEGLVLTPDHLTLADLHLAPMIGYFVMTEGGRAMLDRCDYLERWWRAISNHPAYLATEPDLAKLTRDA